MTGKEQGFLLLTSHLGNPSRPCLTTAQFRDLARRVREMERPTALREMNLRDLTALGYDTSHAQRILSLLEDNALLSHYLYKAKRSQCHCLTRLSEHYPHLLRQKLGDDAPGCLWYKGDLSLLLSPAIALVGSRNIRSDNLEFAKAVGCQAAAQGYVLLSGNARGADQAAQEACLTQGGKVISIVADKLEQHPIQEGILYLSEDGFDIPFSAHRALSRNRLIHSMAQRAFVAQAELRQGGTWDGSLRNLRHHWSPLYCFQDGSEAATQLITQGAEPVSMVDLHNFSQLPSPISGLF